MKKRDPLKETKIRQKKQGQLWVTENKVQNIYIKISRKWSVIHFACLLPVKLLCTFFTKYFSYYIPP